MNAHELTQFLQHHLVQARAAQMVVEEASEAAVRVRAPLEFNLNHHGTAFGGSQAMLGITSGWALLHAALARAGVKATVVIGDSHTRYRSPVQDNLVATAAVDAADLAKFAEQARHRNARLTVVTEIRSEADADGEPAAVHTGVYFAVPDAS